MKSPLARWLAAFCAVAIGGQICIAVGAPVTESFRVHLKHGRSMEAVQYSVEGATAHVTLVDGGSISFPATLVARVEPVSIENQPDAAPPQMAETPLAPSESSQPPIVADVNMAPKDESIDAMIRTAAKRNQIEPDLLAAVIAVESGYDPTAVSPKGAQGLMQLMPGTAKDLLVTNPFDPRQNIDAGAKYLRELLDQHNGSFVDALAAYNAGKGRVARYNGVPPYRETIAYIKKVLQRYRSPQAAPAARGVSRSGR